MPSVAIPAQNSTELRKLRVRLRALEKENKRLHQRLQQHGRLFEDNPQPMFIYDPVSLEFLTVNDAALALYGYTRREFMRLTSREIRPPEQVPALLQLLATMRDRNRKFGDSLHRKKDGTVFHAEITSCPLRFNNQPARLVLVEDVTERKRAEDALRESEQRLRTLAESTFEGIVFSENGVIRDTNDQFARILGYTRKELIGREIGEFVPDARRKEIMANIRKGVEVAVDHEMIRKDGSRRMVEAHGRSIMEHGRQIRISVVRDITARKRAENALRVSEERLSQGVRVAGLGLFEHDHFSDTVFISPMMREICGWPANKAVTLEDVLDIIHPEDRPASELAVTRAHDPAGSGEFLVENRIIRADGSIRWVVARSVTLFESDGKARRPARTIGALLDITQRKEAETALRQARDELEQRVAERTAELALANEKLKNEMAERAWLLREIEAAGERERERFGRELHDGLCQLLVGARLKTEALATRLADRLPAEARKARAITGIIARANEEARALARGLEPVEHEPEGLMSALQQLAGTARKLFGVACHCEPAEPVLVPDHATATELLRIAQESVNNAIKHGKCRFIQIELNQDSENTVLTVRNDGKRFPKRPPSTGMGLKTMQYRAERIGATLLIQAEARGGTRVQCSLPNIRAGLHGGRTAATEPRQPLLSELWSSTDNGAGGAAQSSS